MYTLQAHKALTLLMVYHDSVDEEFVVIRVSIIQIRAPVLRVNTGRVRVTVSASTLSTQVTLTTQHV